MFYRLDDKQSPEKNAKSERFWEYSSDVFSYGTVEAKKDQICIWTPQFQERFRKLDNNFGFIRSSDIFYLLFLTKPLSTTTTATPWIWYSETPVKTVSNCKNTILIYNFPKMIGLYDLKTFWSPAHTKIPIAFTGILRCSWGAYKSIGVLRHIKTIVLAGVCVICARNTNTRNLS